MNLGTLAFLYLIVEKLRLACVPNSGCWSVTFHPLAIEPLVVATTSLSTSWKVKSTLACSGVRLTTLPKRVSRLSLMVCRRVASEGSDLLRSRFVLIVLDIWIFETFSMIKLTVSCAESEGVPAEEIGVRDNVRPHGSEFLRRIRFPPVTFHHFTQHLKIAYRNPLVL